MFGAPETVNSAKPASSTSVGLVTLSAVVSTVMVTVLFASDPSALSLPAASENFVLSTNTTPFVVEFAVGVKVAV